MINYSISEIEDMADKGELSTEINAVLAPLLLAVNDWPTPVNNLYDYDLAVRSFILNPVTKENIQSTLRMIDFSDHAWQAESLSSLIKVYDYFGEGIVLKEIIDSINLRLGH